MSARPLLVFAPGAGLPSTSPWMQAWAERLRTFADVHAFDYPYQREGRKTPDRMSTLIESHQAAIGAAREAYGDRPVVLIGKSMGSRVGCYVALRFDVKALVCLGYPLVGQNGLLRDELLHELARPVLFVQGTRDPLAPLEQLNTAREGMTCRNELYVVPTGDHSLQVTKTHTKTTGRTQDDEDLAALEAIRAFVEGLPA
ncbi:MAG: alpha/beta fold hydrolase [Myxococcales bacterium]|nr:alpha/beta fold hydrolase [Myxococcales bacterium]